MYKALKFLIRIKIKKHPGKRDAFLFSVYVFLFTDEIVKNSSWLVTGYSNLAGDIVRGKITVSICGSEIVG